MLDMSVLEQLKLCKVFRCGRRFSETDQTANRSQIKMGIYNWSCSDADPIINQRQPEEKVGLLTFLLLA